MTTRTKTLFLCITVFAVCVGCSGEDAGDNTFEGGGASFTYPGDWEELERRPVNPDAEAFAALGPGPGHDALIFEFADEQPSVTEENFDAAFKDVAASLQESTEGPTRLTIADRPALRFVSHPEGAAAELTREVTVIFDGSDLYILNCGFTPEHADEMKKGCKEALDSFELE